MLQVNYDSLGKQKIIGNICILTGIFLGVISLLYFLSYEEGIGVFFGIIALILIGMGIFKRKLSKNANQYINLINNNYYDIDDISKKINKEIPEIIEELEELIKNGIFLNIYYDKEKKTIKEIISTQNNNIEKIVKIERCPGCGAAVDITKSRYCEFCGRELL